MIDGPWVFLLGMPLLGLLRCLRKKWMKENEMRPSKNSYFCCSSFCPWETVLSNAMLDKVLTYCVLCECWQIFPHPKALKVIIDLYIKTAHMLLENSRLPQPNHLGGLTQSKKQNINSTPNSVAPSHHFHSSPSQV